MDLNNFLGFGQGSRPDIGLIANGIQNLAEIYESDRDFALRNIGLNPEVLDIIYELSDVITREDLRSASGLSTLLLPTLDMQDEVFRDRLPEILDIDQIYSSSRYQVGRDSTNPSLSGSAVKLTNVLVYNGSIQCEGIEYRTNIIRDRLFTSPDRRYTSVSTSRASLFNSEGWPEDSPNIGYFQSASLSGSIRVRRKSHVNRIIIPKTSYVTRAEVTENPSHEIKCNITNGVGNEPKQMRLLATKNSPLRLLCRMATGRIDLTFTEPGIFFYGFQIQPAQGKSIGPTPSFLSVNAQPQASPSTSHSISIDITSTGYQNSYDLYLYLYLNPEKIKSISMSGIDVREYVDGKDIGLIGFNNLQSLTLADTSIKILPIWLKTLKTTLRELVLTNDKDTYRNGPMSWFDIRDDSAVALPSHPFYTVVSYLTIPKIGPMINEDGNGWADPLFEKYVLNQSRTPGTDYRVFSSVTKLELSDLFYGRNPRFDDVFPSLQTLTWIGERGATNVENSRRIFGEPPKIKNPGSDRPINYNISKSYATGSIYDIGVSNTVTDPADHISKYRIESLKLRGENWGYMEITGGIALDVDGTDNSSEWTSWIDNTSVIDIAWSRVKINLQPTVGYWNKLSSLNSGFSGGIVFTNTSTPLKAPKLREFSIYGTQSTGQIPSLGSSPIEHTAELVFVQFGGCATISTVPEVSTQGNTYQFILPRNFAPARSSNYHLLTNFSFSDSSKSGRVRAKDFENLYDLSSIAFTRSKNIRCRFPLVPTKRLPDTETKAITVLIQEGCNFYDLSSLDITPSNVYFARDVVRILAWNNASSGRGCRLPQLEGVSGSNASKVTEINLSGSYKSTYPSYWFDSSKSGAYIFDTDSPTQVDNLTPGRDIFSDQGGQWIERDDIYYLTGVGLTSKILPGDSIHATSSRSSQIIARVLDVTSTRVIIDTDISGSTPSTYFFHRRSQSIENWFKSGFSELAQLRLSDCRLTGSINFRSGFSKLRDASYPCLDLSQNLLTGYTEGFSRIFSGSPRKITLDLSSNNFSPGVIRTMLQELISIDSQRRFTNVNVRLNNCKLISSTGRYSEYSQEEIFPSSTESAPSQVTSLFRNERIRVFREIPSIGPSGDPILDENGVPVKVLTQVGTKVVSVPGSYVSSLSGGVAYEDPTGSAPVFRSLTNSRQQIVENTLAIAFKTLEFFIINLGFTYKAPNTTPTVVNSTYGSQSTRRSTIEQAGYSWSDVVVV